MESKEINKSKSTLTQDTMSRTFFPSSRIFLLSFKFPRGLSHEVLRCTFCVYLFFVLFGFLCFPFFLRRCVWISPLCLPVFFWKYMPMHWAIQTKTMRKSLRWNNFWKVVRTSVICLKMILENFVWKKSTNFGLWVKFVVIIFIFLRCPFSVKELLKKDVSLS